MSTFHPVPSANCFAPPLLGGSVVVLLICGSSPRRGLCLLGGVLVHLPEGKRCLALSLLSPLPPPPSAGITSSFSPSFQSPLPFVTYFHDAGREGTLSQQQVTSQVLGRRCDHHPGSLLNSSNAAYFPGRHSENLWQQSG